MGRLMDFTTETPDCCEIGDILQVEENKLPTSYWYMIEHGIWSKRQFQKPGTVKDQIWRRSLKSGAMNGLSI